MFNDKIQDLLISSLAADSYCLGAHWIYDADELKNLNINWEVLNAPHAKWHQGKLKGDFTHYGDQLIILDNFLKDKETFDVAEYMKKWREEMNTFKGYMDGATKETIKNIDNNQPVPCGSNSHDMSIIGRIVPLLKCSPAKESFLQNARLLAEATHNSPEVLKSVEFFATLLWEVLEGGEIKETILKLQPEFSPTIQKYIDAGVKSQNEDTVKTIASFGPSCPVEFCFPGVIHLLCKYTDYKEAMTQNAKSGGDSSARGMVVAYILTAKQSLATVPKAWTEFNHSV